MRAYDALSDDGSDGRSAGWLSRFVPRELAFRALAVEVRGPDAVTLGEPARFVVSVRNRLPIPLAVTLPTSRLWGWSVDGAGEADERGHAPPDTSRRVAFGRRERRTFAATWDGYVRRSDGERTGDRWVPVEGRVTFTGYLAADDWERRGLYDRLKLRVVR